MSLQIRKRIEQGFGWVKTIGGLRKTAAGVAVQSARLGGLDVRGVQPDPTWWHR